jgi:hypothetical protein
MLWQRKNLFKIYIPHDCGCHGETSSKDISVTEIDVTDDEWRKNARKKFQH